MARADRTSTVFRPQRLSVLIVTDPADAGRISEPGTDGRSVQHRFVGLLSTAAQRASVFDIPGFGDQIAAELGLIGEAVHSHSGRAARTVLESLPRDVVLELTPAEVADLVREIVGLQERRIVRVFEVPEPAGLWTTVLVYFPRNRFNADLPERHRRHRRRRLRRRPAHVRVVRVGELARTGDRQRSPPDRRQPRRPRRPRAHDRPTVDLVDRSPAHRSRRASSAKRTGTACSSSPGRRHRRPIEPPSTPERAVADLRRVEEVLTG